VLHFVAAPSEHLVENTVNSKILIAGSLNMDLVAFAPRIPVAGETLTGRTFLSVPGGKGANQAYAAARLGSSVAMLGRVGGDDLGRQLRQNLEGAGCDVSGVLTTADATTGIALIFVADSGQNSIVIVAGANGRLSPEDIAAAASRFAGVAYVLLQLESPLATVVAAAQAARRAGAQVILDPAPAPSSPLPPELLSNVDILTPNESEAAILTGAAPRRMNPDEAIEIAGRLRASGPAAVIVKIGEQGVALVTGEGSQVVRAPAVTAVDSTAAGDIFNAALAVASADGAEIAAACRFANCAAALSVTRRGAQASAPSRAEVEAFRG
jgi:ribokinase